MAERIILIAGPTASGKSKLALALAEKLNGIIINADSMQIYQDLKVISARPTDEELARAPHFLYGFVDAAQHFSVGHWLRHVKKLLSEYAQTRPIIFVGGTGLYFEALLGGLAEIPDIDESVRTKWRFYSLKNSCERLHSELAKRDPHLAKKLAVTDRQRLVRALEVFEMTGKSLTFWQENKIAPLIDRGDAKKIVLQPERNCVYQAINYRLDRMVEEGAVEEVRHLIGRKLEDTLPAMKAIGVAEFSAYLLGQCPLELAVERAKTRSRRYAKRQMTWLRNQLSADWRVVQSTDDARLCLDQD